MMLGSVDGTDEGSGGDYVGAAIALGGVSVGAYAGNSSAAVQSGATTVSHDPALLREAFAQSQDQVVAALAPGDDASDQVDVPPGNV